jgi:hypothetical protein
LIFAAIGAILIGLGVGVGYLLHALIPGLQIDLAIVAGAVFAVGLIDLFMRFLQAFRNTANELNEDAAFVDEPFVAIPPGWFRLHRSGRKTRRNQGPRTRS